MRSLSFRAGIALLMTITLLALIGLLATAFLSLTKTGCAASRTCLASARARFAAQNGIAYAVARLYESPDRFPGALRLGDIGFVMGAGRRPTVANRGDDWHYRAYAADDSSWFPDIQGPIPVDWLDPLLSCTAHPSYAHGEAWRDADGDGLWNAMELWNDTDRNGRRDVWSGRTRSQADPGEGRFRLRVEPGAGAKIPIDIVHMPSDPANSSSTDITWPNTANLIDRLGAVLGVSTFFAPTAYDPAVGVRWSTLGTRIRNACPPSGWASLDDLKAILTTDEWRSIRRFLTVSARLDETRELALVNVSAAPAGGGTVTTTPISGLMDLNAAPARFLEATLRYRISLMGGDRIAKGLTFADPADSDPATHLLTLACPHIAILHPDEAHRTAQDLAARALAIGGFRSRIETHRYMDLKKQAWFPNAIACAGGPFTFVSEGLQNLKADMTFSTFFFHGTSFPPALSTYDVDRFVRHDVLFPLQYPGTGRQREPVSLCATAPIVVLPPDPAAPYTGNQPFDGSTGTSYTSGGGDPCYRWALGDPTVFDILAESAGPGARAAVESSVKVSERLLLSTQEDFENISGYLAPWGPNATATPRATTRAIQVSGNPLYSTGGIQQANREVVTTPLFPRDVYAPLLPNPSMGPGAVTLGHALWDHLSPTGGSLQACFPYGGPGHMASPDPSPLEHLGFERPAGRPIWPCSRNPNIPSVTELYGDPANFPGMRLVLGNATPFGTTLSASNQFSFHQSGANNPNSLPALPVGSIPVPAVPFIQGPAADGDFRMITSCAFHFTGTGTPLWTAAAAPSYAEILSLEAELPAISWDKAAATKWRVLRGSDGCWAMEFRNGLYRDDAWVSWNHVCWGPNTGANPFPLHTERFTGTYIPPGAAGSAGGPTPPSWTAAAEPERVTAYYFAEDTDAGPPQYPPTAIRFGLLVNGQKVIAHQWTRDPAKPRPYQVGYNPASSPLPPAEMFFRIGPTGPVGSQNVPLANDERRILDLRFTHCTDVVFREQAGNTPVAAGAEASVIASHDAYRAAPRDFFQRKGTFDSALYIFPGTVSLASASWGGVIPESVWEGLPPAVRGKIVSITLRFYREDGSLAKTVSLKPVRLPAGAAGTEDFCLPAGQDLAALAHERVKSFDFSVAFDVTGWGNAGGPWQSLPLMDAPAVEEILLQYRVKPEFRGDRERFSGPVADSTALF